MLTIVCTYNIQAKRNDASLICCPKYVDEIIPNGKQTTMKNNCGCPDSTKCNKLFDEDSYKCIWSHPIDETIQNDIKRQLAKEKQNPAKREKKLYQSENDSYFN